MSREEIAEKPPWVTKNENDGTFSVSEEDKETITLVFTRYIEGQGVAAIAAELSKSRRPSWEGERQWLPSQVHSLLTDRRLLGEELPYPAAVEPALFDSVQEKLAGNLAKGAGFDQISKRVSSCLAPRHMP
jgi:hypothetical protein